MALVAWTEPMPGSPPPPPGVGEAPSGARPPSRPPAPVLTVRAALGREALPFGGRGNQQIHAVTGLLLSVDGSSLLVYQDNPTSPVTKLAKAMEAGRLHFL